MALNMESQDSKNYLILITHAKYEPWQNILQKGVLGTWANRPISNLGIAAGNEVPVFLRKIDNGIWAAQWNKKFGMASLILQFFLHKFTKFYQPKVSISVEAIPRWNIHMPDLDLLMAHKNISVLRKFLEFDFDFLVLTTSSSYLNTSLLDKVMNYLPKENVVAGRIVNRNEIVFPSGTFRIFSRDIVGRIVQKSNEIEPWLPEDLAIGKLLTDLNSKFIEIDSINLPDISDVENLTNRQLRSTVHYRCTSGSLSDRRDVAIMKALEKRLNEVLD